MFTTQLCRITKSAGNQWTPLSCCRTLVTLRTSEMTRKSAGCANSHVLGHFGYTGDNFQHRRRYSLVRPGVVSKRLSVPPHIEKPPYSESGRTKPSSLTGPEIKTTESINCMRQVGKLTREIMNQVVKEVKIGISTDELDRYAHGLIIAKGAYPSTLNYKNFPKSLCTSVNNCACHGIPDDRKLEDGDLISIDLTVFYKGHHGDCSEVVPVGNVDEAGISLMNAAKECMKEGISICGPRIPFSLIGTAIQCKAEVSGFTVVPVFAGHGIGTYFHGPPDIYHIHNDLPGIMQPGMTFTVEPIICEGNPDVQILEDGWTAVTVSNDRTAQFEETILITEDGFEILTKV